MYTFPSYSTEAKLKKRSSLCVCITACFCPPPSYNGQQKVPNSTFWFRAHERLTHTQARSKNCPLESKRKAQERNCCNLCCGGTGMQVTMTTRTLIPHTFNAFCLDAFPEATTSHNLKNSIPHWCEILRIATFACDLNGCMQRPQNFQPPTWVQVFIRNLFSSFRWSMPRENDLKVWRSSSEISLWRTTANKLRWDLKRQKETHLVITIFFTFRAHKSWVRLFPARLTFPGWQNQGLHLVTSVKLILSEPCKFAQPHFLFRSLQRKPKIDANEASDLFEARISNPKIDKRIAKSGTANTEVLCKKRLTNATIGHNQGPFCVYKKAVITSYFSHLTVLSDPFFFFFWKKKNSLSRVWYEKYPITSDFETSFSPKKSLSCNLHGNQPDCRWYEDHHTVWSAILKITQISVRMNLRIGSQHNWRINT